MEIRAARWPGPTSTVATYLQQGNNLILTQTLLIPSQLTYNHWNTCLDTVQPLLLLPTLLEQYMCTGGILIKLVFLFQHVKCLDLRRCSQFKRYTYTSLYS